MSRTPEVRLWSAGAQPERTALAWSRTALASAALLGLLVRLLVPAHPAVAAGFAAAGAPLGFAVALAARARYHEGQRALLADRALPDGRLALLCALLTTVVAAAAGLYVLVG